MKKHSLCILAATLALAGCVTTAEKKSKLELTDVNQTMQPRQELMRDLVKNAENRRFIAQDVQAPYVAGNAVPLARDYQMPDNLRKSVAVTAYFASAPVDLPTALSQISQSAGIILTATPDALMPAGLFGPKVAAQNSPVQAPLLVSLRATGEPLWKLLDAVAAQTQTSWRPTPTGAEFYRVVTKSYELMAISQMASTNASLGKNSSANNSFNSDSKTSFSMTDSNLLDGLKAAIESMLTVSGKYTVSKESQMLVVSDTESVQSQVGEFVKQQNKAMSRRVRMLVEAIEVTNKDGNEVGIDWTLVYNTATNALNSRSPASLSGQQAGVISAQTMSGPLAGSGMVIQALNEVGTVVNRRVFPFITTSGRPITQALRSTFNYVDQVQATSIASSTQTVTQAPTVSQKDETVGTFLTIVPTAKSDGSIFLSVSFDVTTAEPLRPYTVGAGGSAVTVQQKTINGSGIIQEVPVRSGRTEVVGGIELLTATNNKRRLADGLPMLAGGSDSNTISKSVTVLLVTAVIEEGA